MLTAKEKDTEQDALVGKLGQCESGVQKAFRRLDAAVEEIVGAVDRHAIRRDGQWIGRSYKLGGKLLLRVDPKVGSLRVQVGREAYADAPAALRDAYKQDDWIVVRPEHMAEALACVSGVVAERMQRLGLRAENPSAARLAAFGHSESGWGLGEDEDQSVTPAHLEGQDSRSSG